MAENSSIEWTTHTFNPWIGCTKVAAGCQSCYAEAFAKRYGKAKWGPQGTRVKTSEAYWKQPLKWNRVAGEKRQITETLDGSMYRERVFCASLADVFEDWEGPILTSKGHQLGIEEEGEYEESDGWSTLLPGGMWMRGGVIGMQKITRRPATMSDLRRDLFELIDATPNLDWILLTKRPENILRMWAACSLKFRHNVWLLTSVATQADADQNIPELLKCRGLAPVLGISHEPALGSVHPVAGIDWHIIGCESNGKRVGCLGPVSEAGWREIVANEAAAFSRAGSAVFVKQVPVNGRVSHDPAEWPEDLRVREWPTNSAIQGSGK